MAVIEGSILLNALIMSVLCSGPKFWVFGTDLQTKAAKPIYSAVVAKCRSIALGFSS
jgi:hypothetical protein